MSNPRISVVVPFFNNADLLGDCLASISAQTVSDLQVIMVDDGSTDGSAEIARAHALSDHRFTLVCVRHGGPGWARNQGVAVAAGEFLAFVDADDIVPPNAYAIMIDVLERSGSDFVSGAVRRLDSSGLGPSGLHDRAIKGTQLRTHISRSPELFYDISVWNKLIRRSFWEAHRIRLPEGMLWEDLVAMTMAHVLATSVDVVTEPVYFWRDRASGAPSITQSRTDIRNLRDRITALRMIDDFLGDRGTPAMLRLHQHKALVNDLWLYVRDLPMTCTDYRREFCELAAGYLRGVGKAVRADLPTTRKLAYYLIEHDRRAELAEFASWLAANPGRTPPMVRTPRGLRADLPSRQDRRLAIPDRVFRPRWREFDPEVHVDAISWRRGRLVLEGWAYVPSVDIGKRRRTTKLVVLLPLGRRRLPRVVPARSVNRPDVTATSGQDRYNYDWSGFRCEIHPRWLTGGRRRSSGDWDCFVLVRGGTLWRPARLHTPGPGAEHPEPARTSAGLKFGAYWAGRRLRLSVRPDRPDMPASPIPDRPVAAEQGWRSDGSLVLRGKLPATGEYQIILRNLDSREQHAIPVSNAGGQFDVAVPVGGMEAFGGAQPLRDGRWELRVVRLAERESASDIESDLGWLAVDIRPVRIDRKSYRVSRAGRGLLLSVGPALRFGERGRIRRWLVRDVYYPLQRLLPIRRAILFVSFAGRQCSDNPRAIADELRRRGDAREQIWAVADWSVQVPADARAVLVGTAAYYAALARSSCLIANDHMPLPYRKRRGQRHVQTWHGTPLKRLGYDMIKPSSAAGHRYLDFMANDVAQWDLLISPNPFSTPILRHAFRFTREICETGYPRNDRLLAPEDAPRRAAQVRLRLGLPDGKRVAMYAPTWRDDQHDAQGRYHFDLMLNLDAAAERLGADYVLLFRGHHLMAAKFPASPPASFVIDVTLYPDINDLLLVTDVLITDYSSVMFDFAPTGRPMLFFTYDLEHYRDQLRGFYLDFAAEAPGPLLASSDEVIAALAEVDSVAARGKAARDAFTARFCPLDDGKASARACDKIFGG